MDAHAHTRTHTHKHTHVHTHICTHKHTHVKWGGGIDKETHRQRDTSFVLLSARRNAIVRHIL